MTKVAIKKLSKNPNGYYLFVEGGNIDHGHHETAPVRALYDFKIFDEAIARDIQKDELYGKINGILFIFVGFLSQEKLKVKKKPILKKLC